MAWDEFSGDEMCKTSFPYPPITYFVATYKKGKLFHIKAFI